MKYSHLLTRVLKVPKHFPFTFAAVLAIALMYCSGIGAKDPKQDEPIKEINFDQVIFDWSRTFAQVLQTTNQKHYQVCDLEKCMAEAINGFLSCADAHSSFLEPKTYKNMMDQTSGEFFGIGIVIDNTRTTKDKFLMIIDTIPEGPADKAGVKPLDKIVEIDGESLEGMATDQATSKLKGERNTTVHVKIMRENHPDIIALDIKRDVIKEQNSLCFHLPDQNIYYLSLNMFTENSVKQMRDLLKKAHDNKYKALILDLRNNSGGLLSAAVEIASLFVDKGCEVASTKNKHNKVTEQHFTKTDPVHTTAMPIFILINNYTASAAEILCGCLKLHSDDLAKKAGNKQQNKLMVFVVGNTTFGKGSVQEVIPVGNNCAMKLTIALYFLPFDTAIQGMGIQPDFVVERRLPQTEQMLWFNKNYGSEKALANYIKPKDTKETKAKDSKPESANKSKDKSWSERAKEALTKDNQFRETITLINIFDTAKQCCPTNVSNRTKAVKFMQGIYVTNDELNLVEVKI